MRSEGHWDSPERTPARAARVRFVEIWGEIHPGQAGADAIDAQLHAKRVEPWEERLVPLVHPSAAR